ncbi:hypothetical protein CALVIDRAFT_561976 [Calocera viscosa TUFC12733]|uniref:Wings apart-like protein C-terminal domain-containing protein n=1 Tax=Calocera viscosa (strain TUFC12733) TaxID=1330018 RepID=A0A167P8D1_CALVF|nr:hypothetical protein CALVIDRAFT_561976 [Calocera viscosa TUFC12733]
MDVDAMMADLDAPSIPQSLGFDDFGMGEVTESYAEKAARWGIEDDRADAGLQDPADLRSISFQRSKGENRRFADEVGFLLEGLKAGQALAIRRSSALQFVEKMLDNDFIRKLRAVDGIGRSWDALRQAGAGDGDHVLDGTLFLYIALITKDARNAESLLSAMDDVVSVAVHGLETRIEDDTLAGARVPKGERGLMGTLKTLLAKAELDVEDAKPSTRHLISSSLKALASLTPTPLTLPILAPIIASLLQELRPFTRRLVAFADGKPLLPHEDDDDENGATSVDLVHADNCLQVLERFTLRGNNDDYSSEAMDIVREHVDELSEHLLSLCIGCRVLMGTDEKWAASARGCLISSLRVLVNLSSGEIRWCHAILSQPAALPGAIRLIVQSDQEAMKASAIGGRESAHDVLCLGLALLTNLVEQVPEARASVRETLYNVSCAEGPECTYSCHCSKRVSALRCLVGLYVRKTEEAERYAAESEEREGAESAFVAGHCSVLLSILALNNSANFKMIVKALPGKDKRDKVDRLLTAVRDFTDAQKVAKEAFSAKSRANEAEDTDEGDEEEPLRADHVNPVEVDWKADKTKTVVAQIIQMLEELRDAA